MWRLHALVCLVCGFHWGLGLHGGPSGHAKNEVGWPSRRGGRTRRWRWDFSHFFLNEDLLTICKIEEWHDDYWAQLDFKHTTLCQFPITFWAFIQISKDAFVCIFKASILRNFSLHNTRFVNFPILCVIGEWNRDYWDQLDFKQAHYLALIPHYFLIFYSNI